MQLIQSLFGSKKFIAMLSGLVGLLILKVFKVQVDPTTVGEIVGLVASYIVGQGIADNGKSAAQTTAIANVSMSQHMMPSDQDKAVDAIKSV